jgi:uncharacterized membrane protein YeaQ/YmgE (transglycosylase-associated protein family)
MLNLVWFLLIGLCAGWLAGQILHGGSFGLKGNLVIGVIGALIGGLLIRLLGFAPTGTRGELISATVGAIVLLIALPKLMRRT